MDPPMSTRLEAAGHYWDTPPKLVTMQYWDILGVLTRIMWIYGVTKHHTLGLSGNRVDGISNKLQL